MFIFIAAWLSIHKWLRFYHHIYHQYHIWKFLENQINIRIALSGKIKSPTVAGSNTFGISWTKSKWNWYHSWLCFNYVYLFREKKLQTINASSSSGTVLARRVWKGHIIYLINIGFSTDRINRWVINMIIKQIIFNMQ